MKRWKLAHKKKEILLSMLEDIRDYKIAVKRLKQLEKGEAFLVNAKDVWKKLKLD